MPSVGVQVPLDLEADSYASTSEDSDEDGWMAGFRMEKTAEFYRPVHAIGGLFDGASALSYFESRGFSRSGHTLAAGRMRLARTFGCWKFRVALAKDKL